MVAGEKGTGGVTRDGPEINFHLGEFDALVSIT
jgi:hypothetical protein